MSQDQGDGLNELDNKSDEFRNTEETEVTLADIEHHRQTNTGSSIDSVVSPTKTVRHDDIYDHLNESKEIIDENPLKQKHEEDTNYKGSNDAEQKRKVQFSTSIPPPISIGRSNFDEAPLQYGHGQTNFGSGSIKMMPSGSVKMTPRARRFAQNTSWVGHRFGGTPRVANGTPRVANGTPRAGPSPMSPLTTESYKKLVQVEIDAAELAQSEDYASFQVNMPREGMRTIAFKRAKKYPHHHVIELTKNLKRSRFMVKSLQ
jgi:hypothetical protein